jgi:broad specificity phosphatase PhoE
VKTIYFVRHGQTEWNAASRMQGQQNSDLNDIGRQQAEVHGRLLARLDIDVLYASPLDRARQTVEIVQRHVAIEARYDARIVEWNCGDWSGQLRADVRLRWPKQWAALEADPYHYRGPGCENYPDMLARTRPFVTELLASEARNIAVVSHGMIGRVMVGALMGFDAAAMIAFRQPNDIVYRVRLPAASAAAAVLDRFEAGQGPYPGVVPR